MSETSDNTAREFHTPAGFELREDENCLSALLAGAKAHPHVLLFNRPANYEWVNVTAREFAAEVYEVAKGLVAMGVQPGDRVALLSATRYEWSLLDFAIWAAGAASVPIYPSSSHDQIQWIIEDSGAVLAIAETRENTASLEHLLLQEDGTPKLADSPTQLRRILEINTGGVETLKFEGRSVDDAEIDERVAGIRHEDLASLVYTSGTTGKPKGCFISHYNWIFQVRAILTAEIGQIAGHGTRIVMYLPMAHVLARAVSLAMTVAGSTQSHWSDTSTLTMALQRMRPDLVLGVPRVFEKVRNGAYNKAADKGGLSLQIFKRAERVAVEYSQALDTPEGPSRLLSTQRSLYDRLVYSKIRDALGGQVQYAITGGSAMSAELSHFFRGLGVPVYEGYGLTETTAAAAVDFEPQRIGTVGKPLNGYGARINEDGEILLTGGGVITQYWHNPEATAEAFHDGWFNTGDLGEIAESGHITITGRKKDLIVTAGGKNVSPGPMEELLRQHPLISQALLVGDGKPFIGVLVTLDPDELARWKADRNIPEHTRLKDLAADSQLRAEVQDAINVANATVSNAEAIKKFRILDRDLSEEENELTPTLKVKRNVVFQRFAEDIDALYGDR
ncbi:AMP-dependent synthetase/ligase [Corynebacterium guangdongense]|uniref:Acyl-CoA synthetase n=1 Tax=Corynebacterium guangdongense TaxID=1783348 RepID=A0ABU1ZYJ4_9CORY|nr:long-chain fatty acid--CoA ligase [Corynebacterium guangdongense]MDR7329981.1 long-chain acyl-CoA synthetase [Corynebacterium guangdongense]WJZ18539.1 Long-chain-fatty-acid--CoA ligase FadD15 [Corynebacterium guangdongense]